MKKPQPLQPIIRDEKGRAFFQSNNIVEFLYDYAKQKGVGMNEIACMPFSPEDRKQFAQLIGYGLGGYNELGYVSPEDSKTAEAVAEQGLTAEQARIAVLENELAELKAALRGPVSRLFNIHPSDLK